MPDNVAPSNQGADAAAAQPSPNGEEAKPPHEWEAIWPGSTLDWSSPRIAVRLYVELPFWLMMPDGTFDVKYQETKLKISVVHGCEEIQLTTTHLKSRESTAFIARPGEAIPERVQLAVSQSKNGCSARIHRTTLVMETTVLQGVLQNLGHEKALHRSHPMMYLNAMAAGHLPLVNTLITGYRRAANDPFVQEVTEATVPIWFVRFQDHFLRVSVFPYADLEYRAVARTMQGAEEPADLATAEEVVEFLGLKETPGETILLDAWSYFYAGRFSDSIRGLVSALEVLLEAKYSDALKQHGNSDEQVQAALSATATKFTTRMNNYLQLSKRTIPGPLLSWVPYINGVRLRDELNQVRVLRHKIVHEGHRMSPFAHGPMLRAAETMTWLFDWLEDNQQSSRNRFKLYPLKGILKGRMLFDVEYTADGVKVRERHDGSPTEDVHELLAQNQLWGKHGRALYGPEKDLGLIAKMSLACIRADNIDILKVFTDKKAPPIVDHEVMKPTPGVSQERFRLDLDDVKTAVFVIELDGELMISAMSGVMVRLLQLRVEFSEKRVHGICIVNHQQHLAPACRETYRKLDEDVNVLLASCDLSLAFASDLARYLRGARNHIWSLTPIRDGMRGSGYVPCWPPNSTCAGEVVRVFPKLQVLGVNVDADPALAEGDQVFVGSATGFEATTVGSIEADKNAVKSVRKGLAGLKVAGDVKKVTEGALVFRVNPVLPSLATGVTEGKASL
jgi:hypothetical protein